MPKSDVICGNHIWYHHGDPVEGEYASKAFKIKQQLSGNQKDWSDNVVISCL